MKCLTKAKLKLRALWGWVELRCSTSIAAAYIRLTRGDYLASHIWRHIVASRKISIHFAITTSSQLLGDNQSSAKDKSSLGIELANTSASKYKKCSGEHQDHAQLSCWNSDVERVFSISFMLILWIHSGSLVHSTIMTKDLENPKENSFLILLCPRAIQCLFP